MTEREDSTLGPSTDHPHGHDGGATVYRGPTAPDYTPGHEPGPSSGYAPGYAAPGTSPEYSSQPVAHRRPDVLAGLLLILAGAAAAVSLVLHWVNGETATGMDLVRKGFSSAGHLVSTGLWQPLGVVFGGGVLLVLGLLVLLPARSHRFVGLVALVVSLVVVAAVLVPFADAHWHTSFFDLGFWFACAVAVLGLLGSLKALLTRPKTR